MLCDTGDERQRRPRRFGREWWQGEMKTYFKGGTAVAESLEVLTCSWAACQPEHLPVYTVPSSAAGKLCCTPVLSWDYNT